MSQLSVIVPEEAYFLWKSSWICLLPTAYAFYRGHWHLAPVPGGVFVTSLLYWGQPHVAWRRRLDMTYVLSSFWFQNYMAWGVTHATPYYVLSAVACACYPLSIHLFRTGRRWESTYVHAAMHLLANICNFILYSGDLVPQGA